MSESPDLRNLRELVARARFGALATLVEDEPGPGAREQGGGIFPFASLVALAFDARARPILVLSRLAEHTRNLEACARASILVADPAGAAPLAASRMTLLGACAPVPPTEADAARATFVAAHADAASYASFADFAAWRLEVARVRWVGGFGRMGWLDREAYARACAVGE